MQRITTALATLIIATFAAANNTHAGIIIEAPSIVAMPGTSGSFDVIIRNENAMGGAAYNISGFSLELSISGAPGVHFTNADIMTSINYVFLLPGSVYGGGGPFVVSLLDTLLMVADSEFGGFGYNEIGPGQSYGLARVSYMVDADAALGDRPLIVDNLGTSLSDESGFPVDFVSLNGDLTVVPEPSTGVLLSTGLACAMFVCYRRARRASTSVSARPTTGSSSPT